MCWPSFFVCAISLPPHYFILFLLNACIAQLSTLDMSMTIYDFCFSFLSLHIYFYPNTMQVGKNVVILKSLGFLGFVSENSFCNNVIERRENTPYFR